ncbi:TAXI family TRAP transporter solute-binding subunit [Kiloniella litopenaei]|uniref:TAXI family TRAP transporter solute-binding subunit n=1 Tax=Kiloniella litopenaei TaxID=1549748 RepID=UPI00247FFC3D|nr:TAXI family TRAP transporter solute-binding subunit [Kiloniella litopenaei]
MFSTSSEYRSFIKNFQKFVFVAFTLCLSMFSSISFAQDTPVFRIGTGATIGNYFPLGGIIASSISKPVGSRACEKGGSCGVDGLLSVSVSTQGSVSNVIGISNGTLEGGFAQADVVFWALRGEHVFRTRGAIGNLRSVANLYPEAMHLVVGINSGIRTLEDLAKKKISIGPAGSGTNAAAQLLLETRGVRVPKENMFTLSDSESYEAITSGEIDAFFIIAGAPARLVTVLTDRHKARLLSLSKTDVEILEEIYPFFSGGTIGVGTYKNTSDTLALMVPAQFLVREDLDDELIYGITKALWHESTAANLAKGHALGRFITRETALDGLILPLHPGAERFYREIGMIPDVEETFTDEEPDEDPSGSVEEDQTLIPDETSKETNSVDHDEQVSQE